MGSVRASFSLAFHPHRDLLSRWYSGCPRGAHLLPSTKMNCSPSSIFCLYYDPTEQPAVRLVRIIPGPSSFSTTSPVPFHILLVYLCSHFSALPPSHLCFLLPFLWPRGSISLRACLPALLRLVWICLHQNPRWICMQCRSDAVSAGSALPKLPTTYEMESDPLPWRQEPLWLFVCLFGLLSCFFS